MKNPKTPTDEPSMVIIPKSKIEEALETGKIADAVEAITSNPEAFAQFVLSTEIALKEGKDKATIIRDRGFFKRLFSSPSSDLAKLLLEQNDVMTRFFVILQLLTLQSKGNAKYLSKICSAIKSASDAGDVENGNLQRIAVDFLEQNIEAAKAEKVRDLALMKLLKSAELNAVFESDMRSAEAKAEKSYELSSEKLQKEYNAFVSTINGKLNTYKTELDQKATPEMIEASLNPLRNAIGGKVTQEDINTSINNLENTLNERIKGRTTQVDVENIINPILEDVNRKIVFEGNILRKRLQLSYIIGGLGLLVAIATIALSLLGLV